MKNKQDMTHFRWLYQESTSTLEPEPREGKENDISSYLRYCEETIFSNEPNQTIKNLASIFSNLEYSASFFHFD